VAQTSGTQCVVSDTQIDRFYYRASLCIAPRKNCSQGTLARVQTFRCQYWMKAGARPVDDITIMRFLLLSSPALRGERFRPATCCCDKNRPDGSRRGGRGRLVLVPIDSTNYSQTRRYRGPFSRTLFSQSVDRSATFFTNVDIWFGALGEIKFYDSPGQCLMIPCIHNIYSAVTPINFL